MNARVAILAALPREIAPLVRNWPARIASRRDGSMIWECDRAIAACAGIGRERIALAVALAEGRGKLSSVLSVGYAGALRVGIARNTVCWPSIVIDASTGEHFLCEDGSGTLVTADHVLGAEEKPEMAERWNADLVDMEAAAVARMARARGLPFRTLRVVSDTLGDALPDLNPFIDAHGGFREAAFACHLALHPWLLPNAVRLSRHSAQCSQSLARELRAILKYPE